MPDNASGRLPLKEIAFSADLPRTRSGKMMLRASELDLQEGDLSISRTRHQRRDGMRTPACDA